MNNAGFLASPKWEIIQELATNSQSPTSLAKKLRTSIPNMLHHLKLLEAYGIIASSTAKTRTTGKPPTIYGLAKPLAFVSLIDGIGGFKKTITPGLRERFLIRVMIQYREEWANALIKIIIEHPELIEESTSMAISNIKDEKADLLLITKDLDTYRKEKNKISTSINGKEYTLTVWSHTLEEYKAGLDNNETYFKNFLKSEVIHDPKLQLIKVNHESTA